MGCGRIFVSESTPRRDDVVCALQAAGHEVHRYSEFEAALTFLRANPLDVVIVDIDGPDRSGMRIVEQAQAEAAPADVLVLTDSPSLDSALSAFRHHVRDYFVAPTDIDRLVKTANSTVAGRRHRDKGNGGITPEETGPAHASPTPRSGETPAMLGSSAAMRRVRAQLATAARHDITVLLQGETGTGKDLAARLIHVNSRRYRTGDFCKVNCPAVPESLFESEMFGFERGAFTGAEKQRAGRFELAHHGTLFLDEIGLLPLSMQAKLLEALESRSFYRIGGAQPVHVDARVITATNKPLEAMVAANEFRADLLYRIRVYTLDLPPLREHPEDIPELLDFFLSACARRYRQPKRTVPGELLTALSVYPWPGNVRELQALSAHYAVQGDPQVLEAALSSGGHAAETPAHDVLEEQEVHAIRVALAQAGWNQRQAARLLRLSYSALRRRVQKYGIERPDFNNESGGL